MSPAPAITTLPTRRGTLAWDERPVVMGILNVTPDSFSDGGRFLSVEAAVAHATRMAQAGASIIDVGPESTRPGAQLVTPTEQVRRAIPVIEAFRRQDPRTLLSIDTTSAEVAAAAWEAGADIINDVSALRADPDMVGLVARLGAPVVLMHMQGTPATMQTHPTYANVTQEVKAFLEARCCFAMHAGVPREHLVVDPGLGFGKTAEHNDTLLRELPELVAAGFPVLVGASRKSFIRRHVGENASSILAGSLAYALAAALAGAAILRVHDVNETGRLLQALGSLTPLRA